jgi:PAS domain S-box-containing protein
MQDVLPSSWPEHRLLRLIFEHSSDALAVVDDDGRLVMANRAAREMCGLDIERLFVWTADRDPELTSLRAQLRVGGRGAAELRVDDGQGGTRELALEGRAHGPYYAIHLRDVTEQRRAERELRRLRKLQDVAELAGALLHDFNNALTAILLAASRLTAEPTGQAQADELAREIRETAERSAWRMRRVLSFLHRAPSKPEPLSLTAAITELRAVLELVLGGGIDLSLDLDAGVADAMVERDQLDRVLLTLAAGARAAMPNGGKLTIATAMVQPYVSLTVTDSGPGMPPDARERAFERIDRVDTVPPPPRDGSSGLASAYRFAKRSGGCISVRSAPGQGTTLAFYLPSLRPPNPPPGE